MITTYLLSSYRHDPPTGGYFLQSSENIGTQAEAQKVLAARFPGWDGGGIHQQDDLEWQVTIAPINLGRGDTSP